MLVAQVVDVAEEDRLALGRVAVDERPRRPAGSRRSASGTRSPRRRRDQVGDLHRQQRVDAEVGQVDLRAHGRERAACEASRSAISRSPCGVARRRDDRVQPGVRLRAPGAQRPAEDGQRLRLGERRLAARGLLARRAVGSASARRRMIAASSGVTGVGVGELAQQLRRVGRERLRASRGAAASRRPTAGCAARRRARPARAGCGTSGSTVRRQRRLQLDRLDRVRGVFRPQHLAGERVLRDGGVTASMSSPYFARSFPRCVGASIVKRRAQAARG